MGNLSDIWGDPTLRAVDQAIVDQAAAEPRRTYLGMSAIGDECDRKLWYGLQPDIPTEIFDVKTLRMFEDGHRGEDIMAERLQAVEGICLSTGPEPGKQHRFEDHNGKFAGHADGFIVGLLQAPKTIHVWEHKQVGEKIFSNLQKLKEKLPEEMVLEEWNYKYYCQAVMYMFYSGYDRHYMTVSTAGGRDYDSVRTKPNNKLAEALRERAKRIIEAKEPPARLNDSPSYWKCRFCGYREFCHG